VIRFDMVSNNTPEFWHNKTVFSKMVYEPLRQQHELYVGCDHGIRQDQPGQVEGSVKWFLLPENQQSWMSDHLHAQTCFHAIVSIAND